MNRKQLHARGFQVLVSSIDDDPRKLYNVKLISKKDKYVELQCTKDALENLDFITRELTVRYVRQIGPIPKTTRGYRPC